MTVRGPVAAEELGLVDAHSHVWIEPVAGANLEGLLLDDTLAQTAELLDFRAAGGGAIVDCQPGRVGRNGRALRQLSAASDVHIIASTGFHLRRYYPPDSPLWNIGPAAAYAYFHAEITSGLIETRPDEHPVYPGAIKIAAEATLAGSPLGLFEAAVQASKETGLAIEMHTEQGADCEAFLQYFLDHDLDPGRLIFCHVDKRPDFGLHQELARAGVLLEYDTFVRPKYRPDKNAWPLLQRMVEAGHATAVALATDSALTSMWRNLGGAPGADALVTVIKPRLEAAALPAEVQDALLGGNIARRLAHVSILKLEV